MRGVEVRTLSGLLMWNRAQNLEEFTAGVALVPWNENTMYADADGNIAYWHPGLYPVRSPKVDLRLPTPGSGGYEWEGFLPFAQMPHAVNPAQGYLANWNTKPAVEWIFATIDEEPGQPAGATQRIQDITSHLAGRRDLAFADLAAIDRFIGVADHRALHFLPLLLGLRGAGDLTSQEATVLSALGAWNHSAYDPPPGTTLGVTPGTSDGPAPTIFVAWIYALRSVLFGEIPADVLAADVESSLHLFDIKPLDNLALRVLDPSTSAIRPSRDYLAGSTPTKVIRRALDQALASLATSYRTQDQSAWRRPHPSSQVCSLTGGVIGPCLEMPFEDRGSYIHHIAFS